MINYAKAPDVEQIAKHIINVLNLKNIDPERVSFYRSTGSRARRVQARIHGLGRIWFDALKIQPLYVVEVISEEFDKLEPPEKEKVIIHELMHIPSGFSGGFVPHKGKINRRSVEAMHKSYSEASRRISST
ncbi:MAG: putative metallopeptidase [archaeon]|nr:putative metallopeptidase [archaeon]